MKFLILSWSLSGAIIILHHTTISALLDEVQSLRYSDVFESSTPFLELRIDLEKVQRNNPLAFRVRGRTDYQKITTPPIFSISILKTHYQTPHQEIQQTQVIITTIELSKSVRYNHGEMLCNLLNSPLDMIGTKNVFCKKIFSDAKILNSQAIQTFHMILPSKFFEIS